MDNFCQKCSLQFDKKSLYDVHLKVLHGNEQNEIEIKQEPLEIQGMPFQT